MRAQVAVEYLIVVSVAIFVFVAMGLLLRGEYFEAADNEDTADRMLQEFKLHVIEASTAKSNYHAEIPLPTTVNGVPVRLYAYADPDNIAYIQNLNSGHVMARINLPTVDEVIEDSAMDPKTIIVERDDSVGIITITMQAVP